MVLAVTLHARRRRWPAARQVPSARQGTCAPPKRVAEIVRLTQKTPPHEASHWTARAMTKAVGLAVSTVQWIWRAHGLAPHRWRRFKLSNDPDFAEKLHDIVGLYVSPPAHAVVLSFDEKSQIQALDRTQPGLPMKKGRLGTTTHDYKRHGTTTLFAALNVLDGTIGRDARISREWQHRYTCAKTNFDVRSITTKR
jgi:hypothetical protein